MTAIQQGCTLVDRSLTLTGVVQQAIAYNQYRSYLLLVGPVAMQYSFTNNTAGTGSSGTIVLTSGGTQTFANPCPQNALYVLGASGLCTILEG
jgi:hypothetical protein